MRSLSGAMVCLLLVGCPRSGREKPPETVDSSGPESPVAVLPAMVDAPGERLEGGNWASESLGIAMRPIPGAWSGRVWRRESGRILRLVHGDSGVVLTLDAEPWFESLAPPEYRDCVPVFHDEGPFRQIPALGEPVGVSSCRAGSRAGPVRETWTGRVGDHRIAISVLYPLGSMIAERRAVETLLGRIVATRTGVSREAAAPSSVPTTSRQDSEEGHEEQ